MNSLKHLSRLSETLPKKGKKMPVLFIGHGSPMNGILENDFSNYWKQLGKKIPAPSAVVCISAHWLTRGTLVTAMATPRTIHDFMGFPQALQNVTYPAPGDLDLAKETQHIITKADIGLDHEWGLDHGTWTVVRHMYPDATIPVLQLSIDYNKPPQYHYELAQELAALRERGVLLIGSGNMVHNLRIMDFSKMNDTQNYGFDWALEINELFKKHITQRNHHALIDYHNLGEAAKLAIPTPDHYLPLLYSLGLIDNNEDPIFFNDQTVAGSISMTSVRFG